MAELKEGESYLSGSIGGKDGLRIALFRNDKKSKPTDPDFVGHIQLALWKSTKKPKQPQVSQDFI